MYRKPRAVGTRYTPWAPSTCAATPDSSQPSVASPFHSGTVRCGKPATAAGEEKRGCVAGGVMADEQQALGGAPVGSDDRVIVAGGRLVEAGHRGDGRRRAPKACQHAVKGLARAPGRGDEDADRPQVIRREHTAHERCGAFATRCERTIYIRPAGIGPVGLGVAQDHEAQHRVSIARTGGRSNHPRRRGRKRKSPAAARGRAFPVVRRSIGQGSWQA